MADDPFIGAAVSASPGTAGDDPFIGAAVGGTTEHDPFIGANVTSPASVDVTNGNRPQPQEPSSDPYQSIRDEFDTNPNTKIADVHNRVAALAQGELTKSAAFNALNPDQKQQAFNAYVQHQVPQTYKGKPIPTTGPTDTPGGIDFRKGALSSGLSSAVKAAGGAMQDIVTPVTQTIEKATGQRPGSIQPFSDMTDATVNPQANKSNLVGRVVGGAAPIIGAAVLGSPLTGAGVGASQGVGSGMKEGQEQGYTGKQTAALAAERGVYNAILGLIPGGKVAAGASALGELAKTTVKVAGINMAQAAIESEVKQAAGIKDDGAWNAIKQAATSGESWAQALLFGAVHAVTVAHENASAATPTDSHVAAVAKAYGVDEATARKIATKDIEHEAKFGKKPRTEPKQSGLDVMDGVHLTPDEMRIYNGAKDDGLAATEAMDRVVKYRDGKQPPQENQNAASPSAAGPNNTVEAGKLADSPTGKSVAEKMTNALRALYPSLIVQNGEFTGVTTKKQKVLGKYESESPLLQLNHEQIQDRLDGIAKRVMAENPSATAKDVIDEQHRWADAAIDEEIHHVGEHLKGTWEGAADKWHNLPKRLRDAVQRVYDEDASFGGAARVGPSELYFEYLRQLDQLQKTGAIREQFGPEGNSAFVEELKKQLAKQASTEAPAPPPPPGVTASERLRTAVLPKAPETPAPSPEQQPPQESQNAGQPVSSQLREPSASTEDSVADRTNETMRPIADDGNGGTNRPGISDRPAVVSEAINLTQSPDPLIVHRVEPPPPPGVTVDQPDAFDQTPKEQPNEPTQPATPDRVPPVVAVPTGEAKAGEQAPAVSRAADTKAKVKEPWEMTKAEIEKGHPYSKAQVETGYREFRDKAEEGPHDRYRFYWPFDRGDAHTYRLEHFDGPLDKTKLQGGEDYSYTEPAGPERTFYRRGDLPEAGASYNKANQKQEKGVSVYVTPVTGSFGGGSSREWYYGKGRQVGIGSDEEPLIVPTSKWDKYPGHKKVVKQALAAGKPVPPEVLADYPDLKAAKVETPKTETPKPTLAPPAKETGKGISDNEILSGLKYARDPSGKIQVTYTHPEHGVLLQTILSRDLGTAKGNNIEVKPKLLAEVRGNIEHADKNYPKKTKPPIEVNKPKGEAKTPKKASASDTLMAHARRDGLAPSAAEFNDENRPALHPEQIDAMTPSQRSKLGITKDKNGNWIGNNVGEDMHGEATAGMNAKQIADYEQRTANRFSATDAKNLADAIEHYKNSPNSNLRKLAAYADAEGTGPKTSKPVESFNHGDEFDLGNRHFKVEVDEDGNTHFIDTDMDIPYATGDMKLNAGSLKKAPTMEDTPFVPPEKKTTGPQKSLLGERYEGSGIGSKTGSMFGDTRKGPASELEAKGNEVGQAPKDKETGEMFTDAKAKDDFKNETQMFSGISPEIVDKFVKDDVIPKAKETALAVAQAGKDIQRLLAPQTQSQESRIMQGIAREHGAELAQRSDRAQAALAKARGYFDRQPDAKNMDFIDAVEHGKAFNDPALQRTANLFRDILDGRRKEVTALGKGHLENFIENYFPHIWKDPEKAQSILGQIFGKRPLEGSKSFLKQRTIPTTKEGIAAGLEPVSHNPVDLVLMKVREMDRYILGQKMLAEMKDKGLAKFVKATEPMPDGYGKINDKIAQVYGPRSMTNPEGIAPLKLGEYAAPQAVSDTLNNYLSPGLRGKSALFRGALTVGNVMNQAQLGLSAFHLGFTSLDAATSKFALGLNYLADGNLSMAGKSIAESPLAPISTFLKGNKVLSEWLKPGSQGAEIAQIVDHMKAAGGRARLDQTYRTGYVDAAVKAFRQGNYLGAAIRSPFAGLELAAKPIMEYIVPRQKMGVFMDMARREIEKAQTDGVSGVRRVLTRDDVRAAMGKAWDSVDNRMGQLVYDNLFWNKTAKDLGQASVRSLGWNLGTIRELGGGVYDALKAGKDMATLKRPNVTYRMAYLAALPIVTGMLGASLQYLMTGKGPSELKDYYFPKTGEKDDKGNDKRVALPSYMKDVYAYAHDPTGTVTHKLHPDLATLADMLRNEDYYGVPIRNADDPFIKQLQSEGEYAAKQFIPFGIRNAQQGSSLKEKALPFVGVTPAPHWLDAPKPGTAANAATAVRKANPIQFPAVTPEKRAQFDAERAERDKYRALPLAQAHAQIDALPDKTPNQKSAMKERVGYASDDAHTILTAPHEQMVKALEGMTPEERVAHARDIYTPGTKIGIRPPNIAKLKLPDTTHYDYKQEAIRRLSDTPALNSLGPIKQKALLDRVKALK